MNLKQLIKLTIPRSLHGKIRKIFINPFIETYLFLTDPFVKTYLICSYGGSGSRILNSFIRHTIIKYRHKVKHVHDKLPPCEPTSVEIKPPKVIYSFSSRKVNPAGYKVVFIFRYPWEALISVYRRFGKKHCFNIGGDWERFPETIDEYARLGEDIMNYRKCFDAYTKTSGRNYEIICVNYHKMWDNLEAVFKALELPPSAIQMFPKRAEIKVDISYETMQKLKEIYKDLGEEIDRFPPVKVTSPSGRNAQGL